MGVLIDSLAGRKIYKKALECWQKYVVLIEKNPADIDKGAIGEITDLRLISMVINLTYKGRMQNVAPQTQKIIEALFIARAKEIISGTADVKYLQDVNNKINLDKQQDTFFVNQLESYIDDRIKELSR